MTHPSIVKKSFIAALAGVFGWSLLTWSSAQAQPAAVNDAPTTAAVTQPAAATPRATRTRIKSWWPTNPIYWNVNVAATVRVYPIVYRRPVKLQIWGWGGQYWTTLRTVRTDARGEVWLPLMTMCPDSPCTTTWDQTYRIVVPKWRNYAAKKVTHRMLLVP